MGSMPFFSEIESRKAWNQYQRGLSTLALARLHGTGKKAIRNAILRSGGFFRPARTPFVFSITESRKLRREYETRIRPDGRPISFHQMGKERGVSGQTILAAVKRAGGKGKPRGATLQKHSSERFQIIFERYGWMEEEYWAAWRRQRGRCFWCSRRIPRNSSCVVEHRGGKTRGLCCPDNQCNLVAGHLESNWKKSLREVKKILRRQ